MAGDSYAVLHETLAKVRARIVELSDHDDRISEEETKAILIDPVLTALGWRVDELQDVRREYRAKPQDNPVDYALLAFGKPRLFVEAKALSSTLDRKSASQLLGYAAVVGVGWCLLTNGDEYRLYNSHASVDVDEKLFRSVRLSDSEATAATAETLSLVAKEQLAEPALDALWKSQFIDRRVKVVLEGIFDGQDDSLVRLVRKRSAELTLSEVRDSLLRASLHVHFPEVPKPVATLAQAAPAPEPAPGPTTPQSYAVDVADLIAAGLVQPPLPLEKMYKGVHLKAVIENDGRVRFAEESYDSVSMAGGMARKSVIGAPPGRLYPPTNGWTFWLYRDAASGKLRSIDDLRQRYLQDQA